MFKGSLALNLFHMTHTHMASVWTLSRFVCLSVCLPFPLLGRAVQERRWVKEVWGWIFPGHNRSFVMTGARPCHTPGLWWLLLSRRVVFTQDPPLLHSVFLSFGRSTRTARPSTGCTGRLSHRNPERPHLRSQSELQRRSQRCEPGNMNQHI